jgi:hypothetical protein
VKIAAATTAIILTVAAFAAAADNSGRKLYKWVDEQGVTHYGDRIPPEYAAQEQHIVNKQGIEVQKLEAQKTPEQLAAEEQKKRAADEARARDQNLLITYATVQEIERLRDQRLAQVADQIKVTNQFLEDLNTRLRKLRNKSMGFKPYSADPNAQQMPDQLAEDLTRVGSDIRTQEQNLRQKRGDEAAMREKFESDINRFKELKAIH